MDAHLQAQALVLPLRAKIAHRDRDQLGARSSCIVFGLMIYARHHFVPKIASQDGLFFPEQYEAANLVERLK